jgi:hypothetical protein
MPYDGGNEGLSHDFEVLEVIGGQIEIMSEAPIRSGAVEKTVRRWLAGHREAPEDLDAQVWLTTMAIDLELFTPSVSGRTAIDRRLAAWSPTTDLEREAYEALGAARFRLVKILGRDGPELVRLKDLLTGESLTLLDSRISPIAFDMGAAMRLCPLRSGRQVLISPLFEADEAMLRNAMTFARHGKLPGGGHRCAANLYRDAARTGFRAIPQIQGWSIDSDDVEVELCPVHRWLVLWLASEGVLTEDDRAELIGAIRREASLEHLVEACRLFGEAPASAPRDATQALVRIAEILMETLARRGRAGVGGYGDILDRAAARIAREAAAGDMAPAGRDLFNRLRARLAFDQKPSQDEAASAERADLDRVIQRILALRAKTVDRGCTEREAMAAAEKVAELLARYDLTLDEVGLRRAECAGLAVQTQRRRRASIDQCVVAVADFCDCRAWGEETQDGTLRYIFFGLKADVEAARFLYDLIEITFETETAAFRRGATYQSLRGGERRLAQNSFQFGLAGGIADKLAAIKAARTANATRPTGFDLVAVKRDVVEDELDLLGLHFTRKVRSAGRRVLLEAYDAGQAAGALFEPHAALGR